MTHLPPSRFFPPPQFAEPEGIVLLGGELSPEWLLDAYAHGIFPWPIFELADVMAWWSPDPRAIFEFEAFHASRRLWQTVRSGRFQVTCNRDFAGVIRGCATADDRENHTWITAELIAAYERLHALGHAHSVEVWREGRLAGGVYGVALGGLFAGESMFHLDRDASKVALVHLTRRLQARGYRLFDIQQLTPHTASLGASEISRDDYLRRLAEVVRLPVAFGDELADA